jgi:glycerophosphoryl diester phosphodiesterase
MGRGVDRRREIGHEVVVNRSEIRHAASVHPYLAPGPIAIAHRGGAEEAPENTRSAFAAAVARGYRYLETDVHTTRDGVVVAFHDSRLDRVTDANGAIADLTIAEVEEADAGFHFTLDGGATHPYRGRGETVPRLADLLEQYPDTNFNIDPKADASVIPLVHLLEQRNAFARVCIGAFSDRRLLAIRRLSRGRACTSMGPRAVAGVRMRSLAGRPLTHGADCLQIPTRFRGIPLATPGLLRACHRSGIPVHVWTVDEEAEMERLLDLGVDGIMSDRPRLLASVFEGRGLPLDGSNGG